MIRTENIAKIVCASMVAFALPFAVSAKKISDKSKQKQVKSMEYLDWNFEPAIYYGWLHHDYSGAKSKFLGLDYSFHENKSNVKRAMWGRSENLGLEHLRIQEMEDVHSAIRSVYNEEIYLQVDRLIDPYYDDYKEDFDELRSGIEELLSLSIILSDGQFSDEALLLSEDVKVVNEQIEMFHKSGPSYEMESISRKEGYEMCLNDLRRLHRKSKLLYGSAKLISHRK